MPKFADNNDFFQIIVYILIAIVGLATSAYRNYNKQKEFQKRQPREPEPDFPEVSIPPVFEYKPIFEEEEEEYEVEVKTKEPEVIDTIPKWRDVPIDRQPIEEGEAVFNSTLETILDDHMEDTSVKIDQDDLTASAGTGEGNLENESLDFDLAKAVIFSEILQPKYSQIR